jgi:hypothetical protein
MSEEPCAAGCNIVHAGDTRPTPTLDALAKGTDVFILQNMGPIKDLDALSYESKLLIQVRTPLAYGCCCASCAGDDSLVVTMQRMDRIGDHT